QMQKAGQFDQAATRARTGLQQDPGNSALQALLSQTEKQAHQKVLDEQRLRDAKEQQAKLEAARKRQEEMARASEAARLKAEQEARAKDQAARAQEAQAKQRAYDNLMAEGKKALARGDYAQAILSFKSATNLKPTDEGFKELALAQAQADTAAHKKAEAEK